MHFWKINKAMINQLEINNKIIKYQYLQNKNKKQLFVKKCQYFSIIFMKKWLIEQNLIKILKVL